MARTSFILVRWWWWWNLRCTEPIHWVGFL